MDANNSDAALVEALAVLLLTDYQQRHAAVETAPEQRAESEPEQHVGAA